MSDISAGGSAREAYRDSTDGIHVHRSERECGGEERLGNKHLGERRQEKGFVV
jgi:hypothetical protein